LLFIVLVTIAAVAAYVYTRPAQPILSVGRVYGEDESGSTVLVDVTLTNVPGCSGWLLNLTWDPYYIQLTPRQPSSSGGLPVEVREGPFFKSLNKSSTGVFFNSLDLEKGEMNVGDIFLSSGTYVVGSGVILTLNFTIINVGTSTIEINPASPGVNQSIIADAQNAVLPHGEVNGLVTKEGPPPMWASTDFQTMLIYGELGTLGLASLLVYVYVNPKPPRSVKRRADFQPTIDPQDQE
jgi:hypothetical protein